MTLNLLIISNSAVKANKLMMLVLKTTKSKIAYQNLLKEYHKLLLRKKRKKDEQSFDR